MSQTAREAKRRQNRKRNLILALVIGLIVVLVLAGAYRKNKNYIISKDRYVNAYKTELYFFKDIDYRELDGFSAENLTLGEGEKTNGYKVLTKEPKVVSAKYIENQNATIDQIKENNYQGDWSRMMSDLTGALGGLGKLGGKQDFLISAVDYVGDGEAELEQKKAQLKILGDGKAKEITAGNLYMMGTGYVYTTTSAREKVISEKSLPYVSVDFLKNAAKVDDSSQKVLKLVNNDHVFTAFTIKKDTFVADEEAVVTKREEFFTANETQERGAYYNHLVRRVDLLQTYPELSFTLGEKKYQAYLVDVVEDGNEKIMIMMVKDYIGDFAGQIISSATVNIEDLGCIKVPQSAIVKKDGETFVKVVEKNYFEELVPVAVYKYDQGQAILKLTDEANHALNEGMSIKIYP